jgi:hypothetical protein
MRCSFSSERPGLKNVQYTQVPLHGLYGALHMMKINYNENITNISLLLTNVMKEIEKYSSAGVRLHFRYVICYLACPLSLRLGMGGKVGRRQDTVMLGIV